MTYCVGMLLNDGLVMVSDSRTNAGVDNVAIYRKMHVWEKKGDRVIVLMTAGNLSVSQSIVTLLNEGVPGTAKRATMNSVQRMSDAARLVRRAIREVEASDREALEAHDASFQVEVILGGQIRSGALRLYMFYAAGNFIEAQPETPYVQIGELICGKPILDRVVLFETPLERAAKCALVSMDSTIKSNLSVGPPIDVLMYQRNTLQVQTHHVMADDDTYWTTIREQWSEILRDGFRQLPDPPWVRNAQTPAARQRRRATRR